MLVRAHRVRARIRRSATLNSLYRGVIAVLGGAVVIAGLLLVPLPGPGWVIVFGGLGLWATEFDWAATLVRATRGVVGRWTAWLRRQTVGLKAAMGTATALAVVAAVWLVLAVSGVPGWLPGDVAGALDQVPGVAVAAAGAAVTTG